MTDKTSRMLYSCLMMLFFLLLLVFIVSSDSDSDFRWFRCDACHAMTFQVKIKHQLFQSYSLMNISDIINRNG
jgi:hypothetical protein